MTGHQKGGGMGMSLSCPFARQQNTNSRQPQQLRYCSEQHCLGGPLLGKINKEVQQTSHSNQLLVTLLPHCNKELRQSDSQKFGAHSFSVLQWRAKELRNIMEHSVRYNQKPRMSHDILQCTNDVETRRFYHSLYK